MGRSGATQGVLARTSGGRIAPTRFRLDGRRLGARAGLALALLALPASWVVMVTVSTEPAAPETGHPAAVAAPAVTNAGLAPASSVAETPARGDVPA